MERTYYETRALYWILKGRKLEKRLVRNCVDCNKRFGKATTPVMGQLPEHRLTVFMPAFTNVGVDFFWPFYVTIARRSEKRYGCIFTFMSTRAIHF